MRKVLVSNDDVTPMEFVVTVLENVFDKSRDDAIKTMLEAHRNGSATCGVYTEARADELVDQARALAQQAGHPLQFSIAQAD